MNFEHINIKILSNLSSGNFWTEGIDFLKDFWGGYIKAVVTYCLHIFLLWHLEAVGLKRSFCQVRQRCERKKYCSVEL